MSFLLLLRDEWNILIFNELNVKQYSIGGIYIKYRHQSNYIMICNVSVNTPMPGVILHRVQYLLESNQQLKPRH